MSFYFSWRWQCSSLLGIPAASTQFCTIAELGQPPFGAKEQQQQHPRRVNISFSSRSGLGAA
jgi:hypothetical protein